VCDVLAYLGQHRGSVVSKQELLEHVWPDQYISEATLSGCVMAARKAVGDSGPAQQVIQTLHGCGYRFVPAIEAQAPAESDREVQVASKASAPTAP
jgi:DNA-binding winged helix-turn-helix (wHTH) protein